MATGWTAVTSGSGAGGAIVGGVDKVGADGFAEPVRASAIALGFAPFPFGGSRSSSVIGAVYVDVHEWVDFILPDAKFGGFTWTAKVEIFCADAGTSGRARVRNITDSTTAVEGAVVTAQAWTKQDLVWVPTVGKTYRLQALKGNDDANVWVVAHLERTV